MSDTRTKIFAFDADGVMVPAWGFRKALADRYNITPEMTSTFFHGPFNACLVGQADLRQVVEPFLAEWGWRGSVDDFLAFWFESEGQVDADMKLAVGSLRAEGFPCLLASSQEKYRAAYMRTEMGLGNLFDHLYFSCEIGAKKPEPAYFQAVQSDLCREGPSIVLWDDSIRNVTGAKQAGWGAYQFVDHATFISQMKLETQS